MKPYGFTYSIGWVFLILSSVTAMIFPLLLGQLLGNENGMGSNEVSLNLSSLGIKSIFILLVLVLGAQAIFSFFRVLLFSVVTENTLKDIKTTAFRRFVNFPIEFYNKNKVGELTSRISTDINLLQETLNTTIAEFFRQFITIILGVAYIVYTSPSLALWMIAVIPMVIVVTIIFGVKVKKLSKSAQSEAAKSNSILEEVLMGIVNVKAFTNEEFECNRYDEKVTNVFKLSLKTGVLRSFFVSFIMFFLLGAIVFIIWKAKSMVGVEITTQEFYSFIIYTIFIGASFGSLPNLYASIQKAIGSTEHLMNLIEEDVEESNQPNELKDFKGDVSFNNVQFSYPSRKEVEVLKGISFDCKAGETNALVGSSGAGKSTISSLLLKFYDVDAGEIKFDGMDISRVTNNSLRSQIAVVPQEVILFGGTIKENIAYGSLDATDEEIIEAAKKANAFNFIEKFPDKMETLVGDRGIQLSGGQKQRVAIARAVLKNPTILILDEATSALDTESEKLVQDALDKLMENRTSFVIAHRLSTIKQADNILVLEDGKIVQSGNHNDLIAQNEGAYYKLNNTQLS
jgi:ABC-type multidrug transport system fused ATPase/permease subunit